MSTTAFAFGNELVKDAGFRADMVSKAAPVSARWLGAMFIKKAVGSSISTPVMPTGRAVNPAMREVEARPVNDELALSPLPFRGPTASTKPAAPRPTRRPLVPMPVGLGAGAIGLAGLYGASKGTETGTPMSTAITTAEFAGAPIVAGLGAYYGYRGVRGAANAFRNAWRRPGRAIVRR